MDALTWLCTTGPLEDHESCDDADCEFLCHGTHNYAYPV